MKTTLEKNEEKCEKVQKKVERLYKQMNRLLDKKRKKITIETRRKNSIKLDEVRKSLKKATTEGILLRATIRKEKAKLVENIIEPTVEAAIEPVVEVMVTSEEIKKEKNAMYQKKYRSNQEEKINIYVNSNVKEKIKYLKKKLNLTEKELISRLVLNSNWIG